MTRTTAQTLAQFRTELIEGGFTDESELRDLVLAYAQRDAEQNPLIVGKKEAPARVTAGPFSRDERPNSVATAYVELVPRFNAKAFEAEIDAAIARSLKFKMVGEVTPDCTCIASDAPTISGPVVPPCGVHGWKP